MMDGDVTELDYVVDNEKSLNNYLGLARQGALHTVQRTYRETGDIITAQMHDGTGVTVLRNEVILEVHLWAGFDHISMRHYERHYEKFGVALTIGPKEIEQVFFLPSKRTVYSVILLFLCCRGLMKILN